jgi:hypothetical protein
VACQDTITVAEFNTLTKVVLLPWLKAVTWMLRSTLKNFPAKDGQIDGPGTEVSDDIPAMLSDGEFVMTAKAVKGAGSFNINDNNGILTLTPNGDPSRDSGTRVMYKLMEHFGRMA